MLGKRSAAMLLQSLYSSSDLHFGSHYCCSLHMIASRHKTDVWVRAVCNCKQDLVSACGVCDDTLLSVDCCICEGFLARSMWHDVYLLIFNPTVTDNFATIIELFSCT